MHPLHLLFSGIAGAVFTSLLVILLAWAAVKLWWLGDRPRPPMPRYVLRSVAILAGMQVIAAIATAVWLARN